MNTQSESPTLMNEEMPMNTLSTCINKEVKNGYTDTLKVTAQGLHSTQKDTVYTPSQVRIVNFYRFEGQSDPADNAIMYVIEAEDGVKGILIDAYGTYADSKINKFITEVEEINKKALHQNAA